jgi:hypothetical protein
MPNVNSDGLFGGTDGRGRRVGRSMDYSQLLDIRRRFAGVNHRVLNNSRNIPEQKPFFNQDKFVREPLTNGAVDFYFVRGITPLFSRLGSGK